MIDITSNMISYLFITVFMVIFSSIGLGNFEWNKKIDTLDTITIKYEKSFNLSEDGRVALHDLLKADSYSVTPVGAGGRYTEIYDNFAILMHEENREYALKKLIETGTLAGKIYGLTGMKLVNLKQFNKLEPFINASNYKIQIQGGCWIGNPEKVSFILIDDKRNINNWLKNNLIQRYRWLKQNNKLFNLI